MTELDTRTRQLIDAIVDGSEPHGSNPDELAFILKDQPLEIRITHLAYWDIRKKGSSAKLAEMLALGIPPMSNSDREFLEGHANGNQFDKGPLANEQGDRLRKVAEQGGQNVKGKVYIGGLARFPGDPEAWVSDRGDVKRVVEKRGWKCEGSVGVTPDGKSNELAAIYRESKIKPGPGLDMDEDGRVEASPANPEERAAKIDQKIQENP